MLNALRSSVVALSWFIYTPTCSGLVGVDTCSPATNFDTVIEVFSGWCGGLSSAGCNDDACGLQSALTFFALAGSTYYIRVGGSNGAQGDFELNVACGIGPQNDACTTAFPVVAGTNGPFSNVGATNSPPTWPCAWRQRSSGPS